MVEDAAEVGVILEKAWVVRHAKTRESCVLEPTMQTDTGELFVKVSKQLRWMAWFVVGESASKRQMAGAKCTEMIHAEMRAEALRRAHVGDARDRVASLGFDDDDDDDDQPVGKCEAADGLRPGCASGSARRKRRRMQAGLGEVLELHLPRRVGGQERTVVKVLNRPLKDAVWMKLDQERE